MNSQDYRTVAAALIGNLVRIKDDRASLARLRRCQGRDFDEAVDAYPIFMRVLPNAARGNPLLERTCFTIASLYAGYPKQPESPANSIASSISLGKALAAVTKGDSNSRDGVERRLGSLLRSDLGALPFRLRQTVHFLASKEARFDWVQLTVDLACWDRPTHEVQKRWARQFYGDIPEIGSAPTETTKTEDESAN
ncbi:MAG TPA: type I-E CRISPR-associated protein Cse2/CasB [Chloroflexota bacterium]|nr:type I-E CRISPR-associated protein Cse2/CasB [Chloroflexota bacterium]